MTDPRQYSPAHPQLPPSGQAGGLPAGAWSPHTQPSAQRRGAPGWVIALAVATAVLSVVSFSAVLFWPSGGRSDGPAATGPLEFQAFDQVTRIEFAERARTTFTWMAEDQAFLGWQQGEDLELAAVAPDTGAEQWQVRVTGSPRWADMFAVPGAVVVIGTDATDDLQLYVRDADTGQELWTQSANAADSAVTSGDMFVWFHGETGRMQGIDIRTGVEQWSVSTSPDAVVVWNLLQADLARPTDAEGYLGPAATDHRVAVLDNGTATTLDSRNGTVLSTADSIADPHDELVAFEGRLYVAADERGFQLESYDLENLAAVPRIHYRAGAEQLPLRLEACGEDRMCLLEGEWFADDATEVVVVDLDGEGGALWRQPAPEAENLVPVGPLLFVAGGDTPVTGYGPTGEQVLERPGGVARLNAENLLVFSSDLGGLDSDVGVAGVALADGSPNVTELGQLTGVDTETCTWNAGYVSCGDSDSLRIFSFVDTG